ncbi:calcium-binding protein, partial [Methylobacterium sp. Leaf108]|uniref:calcium-binding protein n=1 Tax=Methylobacterium sp. Leaf108 TaxID=1736256 RepID=UPI00244EE93B
LEVGNGSGLDAGNGLAVRLQAEDGSDVPTGPVGRYDDEGTTFVAGAGVTFDVRDISGTQRGDAFTTATLGTNLGETVTGTAGADYVKAGQGADIVTGLGGNDFLPGVTFDVRDISGTQRGDAFTTATLGTNLGETVTGTAGADYVNAGQGADVVTGLGGNDFLVGGAGDDSLDGGADDDSFIGGAGNDAIGRRRKRRDRVPSSPAWAATTSSWVGPATTASTAEPTTTASSAAPETTRSRGAPVSMRRSAMRPASR